MTRIIVALAVCATVSASEPPARMPMPNDYSKAITAKWLAKPVLETRLIDGMENLSTWKPINTGQAKGEITLIKESPKQGTSSLRLRSATTGPDPVPTSRYYGSASAMRVDNNENWADFNRLSLWVRPDLPGFRVVSLLLVFHNDGVEKSPDVYGKMGMNYVILRNGEWNHVVWEIANLGRDKVTGLEVRYMLQGNEPGAASMATFDIDNLELQKVNADHYEGWNVAPGQIAFSHSGYQTGATKTAIASGLAAGEFQLIDNTSKKPVITKKIEITKSAAGTFQVLNFSDVRAPGTYFLRAGAVTTRTFPIGDDIWKSSVWKAINFFYTERCGYAIPGVHDVCHRDWVLKHKDKSLIVNGGWHDAGDLSQSFANTAESTYAMLTLAERLQSRNEEPELTNRLVEEARWGLDWVMRTSFGDGFRPTFSTMDRWTNGVIGDSDDMIAQAGNNPAGNFLAAAAEAIGSRMLRNRDPEISLYSAKQAEQDFQFALEGMANIGAGGQRRGSASELAAHGVLAAVELWQTTKKQMYADKAFEFARTLTESQQREFLPGLTLPLTGLFYSDPGKQTIQRYSHLSHEGEPVEALALLCRTFPNHSDWMKWYTAVTLYSEYYQKPMAALSAPYFMLANSVHADDEHTKIRAQGRGMTPESYKAQVLNGVKVGEHHYVRRFPVWFEFRGNHGTVLSQTKGVSTAAQLRNNAELNGLAQQQLEWVMGKNPFTQSTMWGEGYDYAPQYSAMSGDLVGSLPVGIQSHGDGDAPYWPTENCHNWKEVWVFPVARWFWLMKDIAGPALVEGHAKAGERMVELREQKSGQVTRLNVDAGGRFHGFVPEGDYAITTPNGRRTRTLLPGATYSVDLRSEQSVQIKLAQQTANDGKVSISATVEGNGAHKLSVRADNVQFAETERTVDLKPGQPQKLTWSGQVQSRNAPWIAVVYPDDKLEDRQEATGALFTPAR